MKPDLLLRAILPEVLIDNFDIERFEKSDSRFDIWLDEKKEQLRSKKGENEPWNADFSPVNEGSLRDIRAQAEFAIFVDE